MLYTTQLYTHIYTVYISSARWEITRVGVGHFILTRPHKRTFFMDQVICKNSKTKQEAGTWSGAEGLCNWISEVSLLMVQQNNA